jgi:hypothetical protein
MISIHTATLSRRIGILEKRIETYWVEEVVVYNDGFRYQGYGYALVRASFSKNRYGIEPSQYRAFDEIANKTFILESAPSIITLFFQKHLAARIAYAALVPLSLVAATLDLLIGFAAEIAAYTTPAQGRAICSFADRFLFESRSILIGPYRNLIQVLNLSRPELSPAIIQNKMDRLISKGVALYQNSDADFVEKELISRTLILTGGILSIGETIFVAGINTPTAIASACSLGTWSSANERGRHFFEITSVAGQAIRLPMMILNPSRTISNS